MILSLTPYEQFQLVLAVWAFGCAFILLSATISMIIWLAIKAIVALWRFGE